jgi:hypothetical protein
MASERKNSARKATPSRFSDPSKLAAAVEQWACEELRLEGAAVAVFKKWIGSVAVPASDRDDRFEAKGVVDELVEALERLKAAEGNRHLNSLASGLCSELPHLHQLQRGLAALAVKRQGKHAMGPRAALVAKVARPMPDGHGGIRLGNFRTRDQVVAMSILAGLLPRAVLVKLMRDNGGGATLLAAVREERRRIDRAIRSLMLVWGGNESKVRVYRNDGTQFVRLPPELRALPILRRAPQDDAHGAATEDRARPEARSRRRRRGARRPTHS